MRIAAVETLRMRSRPTALIVCLHTQEGLTGIGETFYGARSAEAYIHEIAAPRLFAVGSTSPERVAQALSMYVGYQGAGAETRGNSAIDMALWDLLGKETGRPLYALLGGPVRDSVPAYNTCAGGGYMRGAAGQQVSNWGVGEGGPYEDLDAFLHRPAELAKNIRDSGLAGMKVWPFDTAAEHTGGLQLTDSELAFGVGVVDQIREAVGSDLQVMVELHGLWTPACARRIARALEPYDLTWIEDPVRPDDPDGVRSVAQASAIPIAAGETLAGRRAFRPLLDGGAISVAIIDIGWTGGITEARKIAALADMHGVPATAHDCTGPIGLAAGVHLAVSQPNCHIQEIVRAFYYGWYNEIVTSLPPLRDGNIHPTDGPGLGVDLAPGLRDRPDTERRVTSSEAAAQ